MTFTTTAVERMRIDTAGALLIGGTTSDALCKLKVTGAAYLGGGYRSNLYSNYWRRELRNGYCHWTHFMWLSLFG